MRFGKQENCCSARNSKANSGFDEFVGAAPLACKVDLVHVSKEFLKASLRPAVPGC